MEQNQTRVDINKLTAMNLSEIMETKLPFIYRSYLKTGNLKNSEKSEICKCLIKHILDIAPNQLYEKSQKIFQFPF